MKRLVLIGGGHAHLEVLRLAIRRPLAAQIVLVSPFARHHYSAMVPGFLQRTYREPELAFDLERLCRRAGARFIEARAERVSATERTIQAGGIQIPFDLASFDVGSDPVGLGTEGVAENAYTIRPITRALELERRLQEIVTVISNRPIAVCVVGGGAGGVEVAFALHRRLSAAPHVPNVMLLEREQTILTEYDDRARARAERLLAQRGIRACTSAVVASVGRDAITLESGKTLGSDLTVWLTGAAPPALLAFSDLPTNAEGFFHVDNTLRSVDGAPVWGAGDCVALRDSPRTPKAGVYAVRQAPVLARNLRAALAGEPEKRYTPQSHFLALLNTADGEALLRWRFLVSHSRWAWRLKNHIDRAFVRKYQKLMGDT